MEYSFNSDSDVEARIIKSVKVALENRDHVKNQNASLGFILTLHMTTGYRNNPMYWDR